MAVLSLLVVLLLSMVDNASTMWRQSENRVDAYREARAALNVIANDLTSVYLTGDDKDADIFKVNTATTLTIQNSPESTDLSGRMIFVSAFPASIQDNTQKSDLCTVGYFVRYAKPSLLSISDSPPSMNLYRYFRQSNDTFDALRAGNVESGITDPLPETDLLARNITGFQVRAYSFGSGSPPSIQPFVQSTSNPVPDVLEIELRAISNDAAKRFGTQSDWEDRASPTIEQHERTFTKRVLLNHAAPSPTP